MKYTILLIICLLLTGCWLFPEPTPEPITCAELAQLQVVYDGRYLVSGEVVQIPYNKKVMFTVKGLDITGTLDACLDGGEISWGNSCPCTYWDIPVGNTNMVWVNNSTLNFPRNVWVRHSGGLSFGWKIEVATK